MSEPMYLSLDCRLIGLIGAEYVTPDQEVEDVRALVKQLAWEKERARLWRSVAMVDSAAMGTYLCGVLDTGE